MATAGEQLLARVTASGPRTSRPGPKRRATGLPLTFVTSSFQARYCPSPPIGTVKFYFAKDMRWTDRRCEHYRCCDRKIGVEVQRNRRIVDCTSYDALLRRRRVAEPQRCTPHAARCELPVAGVVDGRLFAVYTTLRKPLAQINPLAVGNGHAHNI